jgi:hypothetical protein
MDGGAQEANSARAMNGHALPTQENDGTITHRDRDRTQRRASE